MPEPCRNGTYGNATALKQEEECRECDPGYYCNEVGATEVSGPCSRGYYCPPAQKTPTPYTYRCPAGHMCIVATSIPQRCPNGQYQPVEGQWSCIPCQAGYYCDNSLAPISSLANYTCPEGHYCPIGTKTARQNPCPPGTFNNLTQLENEGQCQPCLPGKYCQNSGLEMPEGDCFAGFVNMKLFSNNFI